MARGFTAFEARARLTACIDSQAVAERRTPMPGLMNREEIARPTATTEGIAGDGGDTPGLLWIESDWSD